MQKRQLVDEVVYLTQFITALQSERSFVAQALFISMSSGIINGFCAIPDSINI